ncbi:MAG TPA: 50S ribosomal protein P1 [Candidatus Methanomethylia archaeon]|nr:50S ribosomal protein P1 [Candidatus Verstraetearchaeota archaeon]HDI46660.1 50S ribosomal protein P1 [Candidatus Methanomethylicia archaeon]
MEYVYASLLLHSAKQPINEENIKKVLEAAGIPVDDVKVKALVAALSEVDIDEAVKSAALPAVAPAAAAPAAAPEAKEEAKKEEETKEEEKEGAEESVEGLAALFG